VIEEYQAYLDESGIHTGASICFIAGWIGRIDQWREFDRVWAPHANAPGFHGKEFFARADGRRVGSYAGWCDEQANEYLRTLIRAILGSGVTPIGSSVDVDAFGGYSEAERRHLTGGVWTGRKWQLTGAPSRPYYVPFVDVVVESLRVVPPPEQIHFTFDQQTELEGFALKLHGEMKRTDHELSQRLGHAVFASRLEAPPLQAADLLSHSWYETYVRGQRTRRDIRLVMEFLAAIGNSTMRFTSKQSMDKLLGKIPLSVPPRTYPIGGV